MGLKFVQQNTLSPESGDCHEIFSKSPCLVGTNVISSTHSLASWEEPD